MYILILLWSPLALAETLPESSWAKIVKWRAIVAGQRAALYRTLSELFPFTRTFSLTLSGTLSGYDV